MLFKDGRNQCKVEEYNAIFSMLYDYISVIESIVTKKKCNQTDCFEGVCYLFAESIVAYGKASFDNLVLGHFHVSNMVNRTILENFVCLNIISQFKEFDLWKYWIIHSFYNAGKKVGINGVPDELKGKFGEMCKRYDIETDFLEFAVKKNYGWTYKINKNFTFEGMCKLIEKYHYEDFKFESDYVHGSSLFQKVVPYSLFGSVESVISILFTYMQYFIEFYCEDLLSTEYFKRREKIYTYFQNVFFDGSVE